MKKLLVLLLIATLAAFVFTGCDLLPSNGDGDGDGDGDGGVTEVEVDITTMTEIEGRNYVQGEEPQTITVTFPAPVTGVVQVALSDCSGNYSKAAPIALFPNADKTVWTGSIEFDCDVITSSVCPDTCTSVTQDCCATTVTITSGACEDDTCIMFPVIVDCEPPEVDLQVRFVDCCEECANGVYMEWTSDFGGACNPATCCDDDCSGMGEWIMAIQPDPCAGPCEEIEGNGCPVEGVSGCTCLLYPTKDTAEYVIKFNAKDNVGNKINEQIWKVVVDTDEVVSFNEVDVVWDYILDSSTWIPVKINAEPSCVPSQG